MLKVTSLSWLPEFILFYGELYGRKEYEVVGVVEGRQFSMRNPDTADKATFKAFWDSVRQKRWIATYTTNVDPEVALDILAMILHDSRPPPDYEIFQQRFIRAYELENYRIWEVIGKKYPNMYSPTFDLDDA